MDEIAAGAAVYVDTNIFIYFIEATPGLYERAAAAFTQLAEKTARVVTSELTVAECLYLPARDANRELIAVYDRLFDTTGDVTLLSLTGILARRAAINGGAMGLKLMDAIHYQSALEAGCSHFLTADSRFKSGPSLRVKLI
jgi:predicted nucleic acid-binding protein